MINKLQGCLSRQFVLYSIIGVSGVLIDVAVYWLLVQWAGVNYQLANCISTSCGITNNFFANAFLNFKATDQLFVRYVKFYCVGLLGLGVSAVLLYFFVEVFGLDSLISKALTIVVVVIIQYSLNKKISFS